MKKQSFFHPFLFLFLFFESPLSTDETYQVAEARTDMSNARDRDSAHTAIGFAWLDGFSRRDIPYSSRFVAFP